MDILFTTITATTGSGRISLWHRRRSRRRRCQVIMEKLLSFGVYHRIEDLHQFRSRYQKVGCCGVELWTGDKSTLRGKNNWKKGKKEKKEKKDWLRGNLFVIHVFFCFFFLKFVDRSNSWMVMSVVKLLMVLSPAENCLCPRQKGFCPRQKVIYGSFLKKKEGKMLYDICYILRLAKSFLSNREPVWGCIDKYRFLFILEKVCERENLFGQFFL